MTTVSRQAQKSTHVVNAVITWFVKRAKMAIFGGAFNTQNAPTHSMMIKACLFLKNDVNVAFQWQPVRHQCLGIETQIRFPQVSLVQLLALWLVNWPFPLGQAPK